jgi:hypothetical protein
MKITADAEKTVAVVQPPTREAIDSLRTRAWQRYCFQHRHEVKMRMPSMREPKPQGVSLPSFSTEVDGLENAVEAGMAVSVYAAAIAG